VQIEQGFVQNTVGLAHLLLQQFQLPPGAMIIGRENQIQIVGASVDDTERLAQIVYETAHERQESFLERFGRQGGNIRGEC
jgi:hypothetical protein